MKRGEFVFKADENLISPYNTNTSSSGRVMRVKEMILINSCFVKVCELSLKRMYISCWGDLTF